LQNIEATAEALSVPPTAVLAGLLTIVGFSMSHATVKVDTSELCEPILLWISICMPTGCAKSSLYNYLHGLVNKARKKSTQDNGPLWCLGDQSFEKLGELMQENKWKILGLYDELPTFLAQINVCRGRTLAESQQVSIFLQLYGGCEWIRRTGIYRRYDKQPCVHNWYNLYISIS